MVTCGIGDRLGMVISVAMGLGWGLVSSSLASPDGTPSQAPLVGTWQAAKNPTNDSFLRVTNAASLGRAIVPFAFGSAALLSSQEVGAVQSELRQRRKTDQEVRQHLRIVRDMRADDPQLVRMAKVDKENTAWLKATTQKIGWIDCIRFGAEAANTAFLIVQHSGDAGLMAAALPEIEKDVKAKRLPDGQAYALLYDRLQLKRGGKQRYGSQIGANDSGEMVVLLLEDRTKVDDYRKELGMPPLSVYLSTFERSGRKIGFSDDAPGGSAGTP